jgi:hypothetical protein
MTLGSVVEKRNGFRPVDGRFSRALRSIIEATDALDRSRAGVSPVTVICSAISPTSSPTSTTSVCWVPMTKPRRSNVL